MNSSYLGVYFVSSPRPYLSHARTNIDQIFWIKACSTPPPTIEFKSKDYTLLRLSSLHSSSFHINITHLLELAGSNWHATIVAGWDRWTPNKTTKSKSNPISSVTRVSLYQIEIETSSHPLPTVEQRRVVLLIGLHARLS